MRLSPDFAASMSSYHSFRFISYSSDSSSSWSLFVFLSSSDELSLSKLCNSYFPDSPFFLSIPNFLKHFYCCLKVAKNSLSCWMSIFPRHSTFPTFDWRMCSNLIFSFSFVMFLTLVVIWSISFIYSWNISLTPYRIARCRSSRLSAFRILCCFWVEETFIRFTSSRLYLSISVFVSFEILAKPMSYCLIF